MSAQREVLAGAVLDLHLRDPEATIPPLPVVHPGAEATIKQAVALLASSPEVCERVVRFMYHRGFMDGALDMAKIGPTFSASVPRPDRQRAIERELVAFNPDTVEALELLASFERAITDRYGEARTTDLRECLDRRRAGPVLVAPRLPVRLRPRRRHAAVEPHAGARRRRVRPAHGRRKVERLFAMHKELMDREAEAAFNDAMARAQANIQPIAKDRRNDHTKSMYATLAAINDEITPIYTAEGLSVSFDTYSTERDKDLPPLDAGKVRVIGFCSHKGGHTRKYHLDGALDDAGKDGTKNKTGIQAMGSRCRTCAAISSA
jgi:hypothetical protein